MKPYIVFSVLTLIVSVSAFAQNTIELADGSQSPSSTIDQVAWLEGQWTADALGGTAEEYWSAPAAGSLFGMFRLVVEDQVQFYEIFTIDEENGSLLLRIKHFHSNLKGWEEKDDTVDFPLVKLEDRTAWFSGLTMKMEDDNNLTVYLLSTNEDGKQQEFVFSYRRVN